MIIFPTFLHHEFREVEGTPDGGRRVRDHRVGAGPLEGILFRMKLAQPVAKVIKRYFKEY